ncbi:MAG: hypothetical protein RL695_90 [Pseudomonadota bacterium]|jgi:uroporphyrinogen-III synthase
MTTAMAAVTPPPSHALAGRHIVVTRPQQQSATLSAAIRAAGGTPVVFPLLVIHDVDATQRRTLQAVLQRLAASAFELAVFVSPNAIARTFAELQALGLAWPDQLRVAVVGKGSEHALAERGVSRVIAPCERYDSEGMLALADLQSAQVQGQRAIIFRGDGGRELIAQTLCERGATVEYVTCYRRSAPQGAAADTTILQQLWQQGQLDAITLTSSEGLRHLHALLDAPGRARLATTPLFVPHERIAAEARQLGLSQIIATGAGDAGLLAALIEYFVAAAALRPANLEMRHA